MESIIYTPAAPAWHRRRSLLLAAWLSASAGMRLATIMAATMAVCATFTVA